MTSAYVKLAMVYCRSLFSKSISTDNDALGVTLLSLTATAADDAAALLILWPYHDLIIIIYHKTPSAGNVAAASGIRNLNDAIYDTIRYQMLF